MPGPVPGIHVFKAVSTKDVDGRDKPGHDVESASIATKDIVRTVRAEKRERVLMNAPSSNGAVNWPAGAGPQRAGCAEALMGPRSPCAEITIGLPAFKPLLPGAATQRRVEPPST